MRKKITTIVMLVAFAVCILCSCKGDDEQKETATTAEEATSESGNIPSETTEQGKNYTFDIGEWWRYAYEDEQYKFFYMNESEEIYDSNVILSVTEDESLKKADTEVLKNSLKTQYGENIKLENGKINGCKYVYVELEQENGDEKAYIGQYIIIGNEEAVIFSVYAQESKFEAAVANAKKVVETIAFY